MRRWNGWGEQSRTYPLAESAVRYLSSILGEPSPGPDAPLEAVLARVPPSRLPDHPMITKAAAVRLRHARGQSLPDWIALRSGDIGTFPDGVNYPSTEDEVQAALNFAYQNEVQVIPYGGGTSVVGHINPQPGEIPKLTLDLSRMNHLIDLDETDQLATFQAGVHGPYLERQLRTHGYTLGHFPQSFEFSTLGGWIATRSTGQQSYYYGRIEDLFAGGHVVAPAGLLNLPAYPASAAGPDLRQVVLGSEGRYGIITRATVRVRPLPPAEGFYAIFFHDWESGVSAVREIVQANIRASMLRLSDAQETTTTLMLSGKNRLVTWAERGLRLLGFSPDRCLLIFGATGEPRQAGEARDQVIALARKHKALPVGAMIGDQWRKSRFTTPYLRNALWELGYALDTLETAVSWNKVLEMTSSIKTAIRSSLEAFDERALVFAHLSHVYRDGASIYVAYLFRRAPKPEDTYRRWQAMKSSASHAILAHDGTISHQHGVGRDHATYLKSEKGQLGINVLKSIGEALDPKGLLNPGVMYADNR
jgi:alkyldihydroxyacetonephosphate synthase